MHVRSLISSIYGRARVERVLTCAASVRRCLSATADSDAQSSAQQLNNAYYALCAQHGARPQYVFTKTSDKPPLYTAQLVVPRVLIGAADDVSVVVSNQTSKTEGRRRCSQLAFAIVDKHCNELRATPTPPQDIAIRLRDTADAHPLSALHNANVQRLSADRTSPSVNTAEAILMLRAVQHFDANTAFTILYRYEWDYIDGRSDLGRGDLVLTDGNGNFAVIEVKVIFNVKSDGGTAHTLKVQRNHKRVYVKKQVEASVNALKRIVPDFEQITGFTYTDDAMQGADQKLEQCLVAFKKSRSEQHNTHVKPTYYLQHL